MPNLDHPLKLSPVLTKILEKDKAALEATALPIVTVAGTFREDIKGFYGLPEDETITDVVLSRAHYSMPVGAAIAVWGTQVDQAKTWIVDPTNYVGNKDFSKVSFTHSVGRTLARYPVLKLFKDFVDRFGRQKMPILASITPPLLYVTEKVTRPILSFHIAAGNILVEHGKTVVQVVTDPHVRDEYVSLADQPHLFWCVFDERTKIELLEKAHVRGITVDPSRVVVTGPPIDPRIVAARTFKQPWVGDLEAIPATSLLTRAKTGSHGRALRLCLTTGGLGTNKVELNHILTQLLPLIKQRQLNLQILVYAGTQADIAAMVEQTVRQAKIKLGKLDDLSQPVRLIYHPQLVDANEMLIKYGFPWADGFVTKPSGDMAYDAAAAGCFLLTLSEWGEWEHQVRAVFEQRGVARRADTDHFADQLQLLCSPRHGAANEQNQDSWVTLAMEAAANLPPIFVNGSKNIIKMMRHLSAQ